MHDGSENRTDGPSPTTTAPARHLGLDGDPPADPETRAIADAAREHLTEALRSHSPEIFLAWARWQASTDAGRSGPSRLGSALERTEAELRSAARSSSEALELLAEARAALQRLADEPAEEPHPLAVEYLSLLHAGRTEAAVRLLCDEVRSGLTLEDLYLDVLTSAQVEVGRLWQCNEITVADEHYFTGVAQMVMARLADRPARAERAPAPRLLTACVAGNRHELGLRMVSDLFQLDGWEVRYLGADTPPADLADLATRTETQVVALSASMAPQGPALRATVQALEGARFEGRVALGGPLTARHPEVASNLAIELLPGDPRAAMRRIRELVDDA